MEQRDIVVLTKWIFNVTNNPKFNQFVRHYELCSENRNKCEGCPKLENCRFEYDSVCDRPRRYVVRPPLWGGNE